MSGSGLFGNESPLKPHLVTGTTEVGDLRRDVGETFKPMAAITVDEFINPEAGAADSLMEAMATVASVLTLLPADLDSDGLATLAAYPRNVTFTTGGTTANAPANVVVHGTYRGKAQTEQITVAQTATIATGIKPFSTITSIVFPAADGTAATISIGIGDSLGLGQAPKARSATYIAIANFEDAAHASVTGYTINAEGLYTPVSSPDGETSYVVYYEYQVGV